MRQKHHVQLAAVLRRPTNSTRPARLTRLERRQNLRLLRDNAPDTPSPHKTTAPFTERARRNPVPTHPARRGLLLRRPLHLGRPLHIRQRQQRIHPTRPRHMRHHSRLLGRRLPQRHPSRNPPRSPRHIQPGRNHTQQPRMHRPAIRARLHHNPIPKLNRDPQIEQMRSHTEIIPLWYGNGMTRDGNLSL